MLSYTNICIYADFCVCICRMYTNKICFNLQIGRLFRIPLFKEFFLRKKMKHGLPDKNNRINIQTHTTTHMYTTPDK